MDPLTAFANIANAILNLATEAIKGQTPEQKAIIWDWVIKDITWWRHKLKLDTD